MKNSENLKKEFNKELTRSIKESKDDLKYNPTRFLQMLNSFNGDGVLLAFSLASKRELSDGFNFLAEKDRLDLSLETLVIKSKYQILFNDKIIKICKFKLKQCGYKIFE